MDDIHCTIVDADESSRKLHRVSLQAALEAFQSFPWDEEVTKAVNKTGCFPTISLGAGRRGEKGYMNIIGSEDGEFSVMVETYKPTTILGLIPWKKKAYRMIEPLDRKKAESCLRMFFGSEQQEFFEWIENQEES